MWAAVVVAMARLAGCVLAAVVLVERDGRCPVPARAGANLVGLQVVSGLHADVVLPAFVERIDAASPY